MDDDDDRELHLRHLGWSKWRTLCTTSNITKKKERSMTKFFEYQPGRFINLAEAREIILPDVGGAGLSAEVCFYYPGEDNPRLIDMHPDLVLALRKAVVGRSSK